MITQGMKVAARLGVTWMLAAGTVASAATYNWNSSNGLFHQATNWSPQGVPGINDLAQFNLSGSYTVKFTQNQSVANVWVTQGTARFAASRSLAAPVPRLQISNQLRLVGSTLWIGDDNDPATSQDYMYVVVGGGATAQDNATIRIVQGSSLETDSLALGTVDGAQPGSSGTLIVSGWDAIDIAYSTLTVHNNVAIGRGNGSGQLMITDNARAWIGGSLFIDDSPESVNSSGIVQVNEGGSLALGDLVLGTSGTSNFSSMLAVNGEGSTVTQHDDASITLGSKSATTALISVRGGGSFTSGGGLTTVQTSGVIQVGWFGEEIPSIYRARGNIAVQDGGRIEIMDGGEMHLRVNRTLLVNHADSLQINGGVLHVNGANIITPYINFSGNGRLNFNYGRVEFTGDLLLDDAYTQRLLGPSMQITDLQTLAVGGNATLETPLYLDGGTLEVGSLINGWLLQFNRGTLALTTGSLDISASGQFGDTLTLRSGQTLRVDQETHVDSHGQLVMDGGRFIAGTVGNSGEIRLKDSTSRLDIENLKNSGAIHGTGTITSTALQNLEEGEIRVADGQRIRVVGELLNTGRIDVIGGELDVAGPTRNGLEIAPRPPLSSVLIPGNIFARDAILRFGGDGLSNLAGTLGFSFGTSDVFGSINNLTEGTIIVSGGSNVTFYDNVVNQGEIRVSEGSTAVYFGHVSGNGVFTGEGLNFFEGTFSPGMSPAVVTFEGDYALGENAVLEIEIGGLTPGGEHDQLRVDGNLFLNGTLRVTFINGFASTLGDVFHILDFDRTRRIGTFDVQDLPNLGNGLWWNTDNLYTLGTIAVIPEPTGAAILLLSAGVLLRRHRR